MTKNCRNDKLFKGVFKEVFMEIEVCVDKRTELLGVLLLISDYGKLNPELVEVCHNEGYRAKVFKQFGAFKNDKAVKLFNQMCEKLNFNYDAPIALILQLDENFKFDTLPPYPFEDRLESSNLVIEFLKELPRFVKASGFEEFYKSNQKYYNKIIKETEKSVHSDVIEKFFNEFYKMDIPTQFVINLMPHSTHGNYGVGPIGKIECNLSTKDVDGKLSFVWDDIGDLFVHEFGHSIVNPLVDKYVKLPQNYFKRIYKCPLMVEGGYSTDITILDEMIIRSIGYVYLKYYYKGVFNGKTPAQLAEYVAQDEKEGGFIYLGILIKLIEEYYLNREKYTNFEAFMPTLIKQFKKEKAEFDKTNSLLSIKI